MSIPGTFFFLLLVAVNFLEKSDLWNCFSPLKTFSLPLELICIREFEWVVCTFWNLPGNPNAVLLWLALGANEADSFGFLTHPHPLLAWDHHPLQVTTASMHSPAVTGFSYTLQVVHLAPTFPQNPRSLPSFLFSTHFISCHCYSDARRDYLWGCVPGLCPSSKRQKSLPTLRFPDLRRSSKKKGPNLLHRMNFLSSSFLLTSSLSSSFSGLTWGGAHC